MKKSSIGRKKTKRRTIGKIAAKSLPATVKAFGKTWTKKSCSKTKTAASKTANASRKAGKAAMVKKNPTGGYCTFVRGRKKS